MSDLHQWLAADEPPVDDATEEFRSFTVVEDFSQTIEDINLLYARYDLLVAATRKYLVFPTLENRVRLERLVKI